MFFPSQVLFLLLVDKYVMSLSHTSRSWHGTTVQGTNNYAHGLQKLAKD